MGTLKVPGMAGGYELTEIILVPGKNMDKMIPINKENRQSIGKGGGDILVYPKHSGWVISTVVLKIAPLVLPPAKINFWVRRSNENSL